MPRGKKNKSSGGGGPISNPNNVVPKSTQPADENTELKKCLETAKEKLEIIQEKIGSIQPIIKNVNAINELAGSSKNVEEPSQSIEVPTATLSLKKKNKKQQQKNIQQQESNESLTISIVKDNIAKSVETTSDTKPNITEGEISQSVSDNLTGTMKKKRNRHKKKPQNELNIKEDEIVQAIEQILPSTANVTANILKIEEINDELITSTSNNDSKKKRKKNKTQKKDQNEDLIDTKETIATIEHKEQDSEKITHDIIKEIKETAPSVKQITVVNKPINEPKKNLSKSESDSESSIKPFKNVELESSKKNQGPILGDDSKKIITKENKDLQELLLPILPTQQAIINPILSLEDKNIEIVKKTDQPPILDLQNQPSEKIEVDLKPKNKLDNKQPTASEQMPLPGKVKDQQKALPEKKGDKTMQKKPSPIPDQQPLKLIEETSAKLIEEDSTKLQEIKDVKSTKGNTPDKKLEFIKIDSKNELQAIAQKQFETKQEIAQLPEIDIKDDSNKAFKDQCEKTVSAITEMQSSLQPLQRGKSQESIESKNKKLEEKLLSKDLADLLDSGPKVDTPKEENVIKHLELKPDIKEEQGLLKEDKPKITEQPIETKLVTNVDVKILPTATEPLKSGKSQSEKKETTEKKDLKKSDKSKPVKVKSKPTQSVEQKSQQVLVTPTVDFQDQSVEPVDTEDKKSLVSTDSKNVHGSDFVPSVDEAKSLITSIHQDILHAVVDDRDTSTISPTTSKRNKDEANLKESDQILESKLYEMPEKSPQEKLEPVQFPSEKLVDILEAKMITPAPLEKDKDKSLGAIKKQPQISEPKKSDVSQGGLIKSVPKKSDNPTSKTQNKSVTAKVVLPSKDQKTTSPKPLIAPAVKAHQKEKSPEKGVKDLPKPKNPEQKVTASDSKEKSPEKVANVKEPSPKPKILDNKGNPTITSVTSEGSSKKANIKTDKKSPEKVIKAKKDEKSVRPQTTPVSSKSPEKSPPIMSNLNAKQGDRKKTPPIQPNQKPIVPPKPSHLLKSDTKNPVVPKEVDIKTESKQESEQDAAEARGTNVDEEEEFIEYKFTPRQVFINTICQVCKVPLQAYTHCNGCQMISYCSEEHMIGDQDQHKDLCAAIQEVAKKRGGHVYNNARILNDDDYRSLRVHTLNVCENILKRHLQPFEREILLFPRVCMASICREWRQPLLANCKQCEQVSYCLSHPEHLLGTHQQWCHAYGLYQKLVVRQSNVGRIEPSLPSRIMLQPYRIENGMDDVFKELYKNYGSIKDECIYITLSQLATVPLTAYYASQQSAQHIGETYTIHLIGAELQFEADTLDKWETFFLHLAPQLMELRIVFIGPELNSENLPLEILSRIRVCRICRQNCRVVKFDFQCGKLYHDYVQTTAFTKPDLVCFYNPGLYRTTAYNGMDTWPETIKSAITFGCPILITSYTEIESPRDLERLQQESNRKLEIIQPPELNPFRSQRPERNFVSDEIAPMIFKNYFYFIVK